MNPPEPLDLAYPTIARYRLSLVREAEVPYEAKRCTSPATVAQFLQKHVVGDRDREVMGAVFLDTRQQAIGHTIAYVGTVNRTAVEPRGLLVPALLVNASGFILFHNHPSGDPSPSAEDLAFTRRCLQAGEIVGVPLVDHLILGAPFHFVSLRERGL